MYPAALTVLVLLTSFLATSRPNSNKELLSPKVAKNAETPSFGLSGELKTPGLSGTTFADPLRPSISRFNLSPLQVASPSAAYKPPPTKVAPAESYTIILVGDSMTDYLGENADQLGKYLKEYYPDKIFGIFNYGFGSTNILSVKERLEKTTTYKDKQFYPILERYFDLILIESFGYNPLAQYSLEEGIKKQNEALDEIVESIRKTHPDSEIIFVATIAPSKARYAENVVDISIENRTQQATERMIYIANHIQYAQQHNIPLVNIFEKSLNEDGSANLSFINPTDYIHPSAEGVDLISKEIAKFIYETGILPH